MHRHVVRPLTAAVVLTAVLAVMSAAPVVRAAASTPCGSDCSPLVTAGRQLVDRTDGPPGLVVVVDRRGTAVEYDFGTAEVGRSEPPTASDHVRLASVSKAYGGAVALALVARGTLHLTDTVGRWIPGVPAAWAPVTLAELLHHTSGIPDFSRSPAFLEALQDSLLDPPTPRTLVGYAFGLTMAFTPPGSAYAYSNTDNILVGLMVQAATGRTYESELASLVFGPLGLTSTSLPRGADVPAPVAHGYQLSAGSPPEDVTNLFAAGWTWASGGIVATPADADRFIRAYARGATTSPAVHDAQFSFRPGSSEPPGPGTNSAGLAVFRYATRCGTVYGHTGNTAGYTQFAASTADGTRSVVVSATAQITPTSNPSAFPVLRALEELAVCAALAR